MRQFSICTRPRPACDAESRAWRHAVMLVDGPQHVVAVPAFRFALVLPQKPQHVAHVSNREGPVARLRCRAVEAASRGMPRRRNQIPADSQAKLGVCSGHPGLHIVPGLARCAVWLVRVAAHSIFAVTRCDHQRDPAAGRRWVSDGGAQRLERVARRSDARRRHAGARRLD